MKMKRIFRFALLVFAVALFVCVAKVDAMNTVFSTKELTEEERSTFVSNIGLALINKEPDKRSILCFDVNEQGMIAIGRESSQGKETCVYSSDREFLYGYTFNSSGSFGVEFDDELINIYFVRSDIIISLDADGNILDVKAVETTRENNTYISDLLYTTTRTIGNNTYQIKNSLGILDIVTVSYSQIVVTEANGEERLIYDVSSQHLSKTIVSAIAIGILIFVIVAVVVYQNKTLKMKTGE